MTVYTVSSLLAFLVCLFLVLVVVLQKNKSQAHRDFVLVTLFTGIWSLFPVSTVIFPSEKATLLLVRVVYLFAVLAVPAFLKFGLTIVESSEKRHERSAVRIAFFSAFLFLPFLFSRLLIAGVRTYQPYSILVPGPLFPVFIGFFLIICVYTFLKMLSFFRKATGHKKNQVKYVFTAYFLAFLGGMIHFGTAYGLREVFPHDIFIVCCMTILAYAIAKNRLMDIRIVAARAMAFLLAYIPILTVPFIIALRGKTFFEHYFGEYWWIFPMIISTILAPAGLRVYQYIKVRAERAIRSKKLVYLQEVSDFLEDVKGVRGLDELVGMILSKMSELVRVDYTGLYLRDKKKGVFSLEEAGKKNEDESVTAHTEISEDNALIRLLIKEHKPLVREELRFEATGGRSELVKEAEIEMNNINASVVIPSFHHKSLIAAIVLGEQISYEPYENEDIDAFNDLGVNIGMAIKNALFVEDLNKTHAKLLKSQEEAVRQENLISLGYMVTNLSHELRNPMHVISANIEEMQDVLEMDIKKDDLDDKTNEAINYLKEKMGKAYERAEKTRKMLDSIMDAIREKGQKFDDIDLKEMIDEVITRVAPYTKGGAITVTNEIPEGFPHMSGDRVMMEQVFVNLITNATQMFEVSGKGDKVSVRAQEDSDMIRIEVSDNGPGIPEYDLERIFEPFYTTKDNLFAYAEGKSKGTGLGLMITQQTVRKHRGRIWAESVAGEGATFFMEFPKIVQGERNGK
ncbi:MAG: ATP-binding protein [Candidatus Omnitrophota bacterium]